MTSAPGTTQNGHKTLKQQFVGEYAGKPLKTHICCGKGAQKLSKAPYYGVCLTAFVWPALPIRAEKIGNKADMGLCGRLMTKKVAGLQFQSAEMTGREKGHNFSPKFS
jgi:hypothetical protein